MKKNNQIELPFEGAVEAAPSNTLAKVEGGQMSSVSVVCLSKKRLERHITLVHGRLVQNGFGRAVEAKR